MCCIQQRKVWPTAEVTFMKEKCAEEASDIKRCIEGRQLSKAADFLTPLVRKEFYARPYPAETADEFRLRKEEQFKSTSARKKMTRRVVPETDAELEARGARLHKVRVDRSYRAGQI